MGGRSQRFRASLADPCTVPKRRAHTRQAALKAIRARRDPARMGYGFEVPARGGGGGGISTSLVPIWFSSVERRIESVGCGLEPGRLVVTAAANLKSLRSASPLKPGST